MKILDFLSDNWQPIVGYFTLLWAIWNYFSTRKRDLAWKRTEFLFQQGQLLDSDPQLVEVATILEGRHPRITVDKLFSPRSRLPKTTAAKYRQKFDKFLNVYERIAYSVIKARTISLSEVMFLGSFLEQIANQEHLAAYCRRSGFREVILLAKLLLNLPKDLTEAEIDAA